MYMNNSYKILFKIMAIVFIGIIIANNVSFVFADNLSDFNSTDFNTGGESVEKIDTSVLKIWKTVVTILQIASVAAVIITGLKYMFASSEKKADIKSMSLGFIVGAVIVFGSSYVVSFVINAVQDTI